MLVPLATEADAKSNLLAGGRSHASMQNVSCSRYRGGARMFRCERRGGGFDHKVTLDESGIWERNVQKFVEYGTIAAVVGGAV